MFFEMVYDKSLAQASYVIGCQAAGVAAVIDAKRDVDTYLKIAERNNFKITHILETHIHADFLAGSRELAALTGADMYLSDEGDATWQYQFPHKGLKHEDIITIGNLRLEVLHTPGHTPEHVSFLLADLPATAAPVMLFTGDFVFVGDVGRPDLLEKAANIKGTQEAGAKDMYQSLLTFNQMADHIQVWPGHGAGSACGKALGAVPSSTVGYEKIRNWALQLLHDEAAFVIELLKDQPEPPRYFAKMKQLNKEPRALLTSVPLVKNLSNEEWHAAKEKKLPIIDTRSAKDYAHSHLLGSINIAHNNSFSTWMGWFIDYAQPFVLIAATDEMDELTRKLMRIGLDDIHGYITPDQLKAYEQGALEAYLSIGKAEVQSLIKKESTQIIDVRGAAEYHKDHIPGSDHVFLGTLPNNLDRVDRDKTVVVHCQSGARSAIANSILRANGFTNILNYAGGMSDWVKD